MTKFAAALVIISLFIVRLLGQTTATVSAAPRAQATAVTPTTTDEPVKPPYVFPTPVFIPTYPGDTPAAPSVPIQATGQTTYTVQSGDSPWTIAQKVYGDGTKYPAILSANGLTSASRLRVGQLLQIPALAGPATTPPANAATPSASTPIPSTRAPTAAPSADLAAVGTPTRTPAAGPAGTPSIELSGLIVTGINILAAILGIGGIVAAVLAVLVFARERRMASLNAPKKWLTFR
jgi:LysM repeat protein